MKPKTIKTSELEGAALDWAVAIAVGHEDVRVDDDKNVMVVHQDHHLPGLVDFIWFDASTNWSQGGPLIERYCMPLDYNSNSDMWAASVRMGRLANSSSGWVFMSAPTPLIAACRAIVAAKLGDVVDVPEELVETV